jgi:hypothetical protein
LLVLIGREATIFRKIVLTTIAMQFLMETIEQALLMAKVRL